MRISTSFFLVFFQLSFSLLFSLPPVISFADSAVEFLNADGQSIEAGEVSKVKNTIITIDQLLNAPAFKAHEGAILESAQRQVTALASAALSPFDNPGFDIGHGSGGSGMGIRLKHAIETRGFRRIADVKLNLLGLPDFIGVCLAGHASDEFVIEACATTIIFVSSMTVSAKYLFTLSSSAKNEWHLGPSISGGKFATICFDSCEYGLRGDAQLSLEFVHWFKPHVGFVWSLDIGGGVLWYDQRTDNAYHFIPSVKNSVGIAF